VNTTLSWRTWSSLMVIMLCLRPALGQTQDQTLATARRLVSAGKIAESESVLHDFLAKNPSSADGYFLLGYTYFREQHARESLAAFTAGARFRRPATDDFKVIASDYVLLGAYVDAEKWFLEVTRETPQDVDAWYLLGRAQYNADHFTNAVSSFQTALQLRPKYVEAENNLGLAFQGLNQSDQAAAAYRQAIAWQGDQPTDGQPFLNLGTALADQGDPEKAVEYLETAVKLAPKNPAALEQLGRALAACNRLPEAQHQLEEAVALAGDVSGPHFRLGRVYQREGLRDLARQQFDICQKLDSAHSSVKTPNPYRPE
jgi:Flp pilus assembly protein TadD